MSGDLYCPACTPRGACPPPTPDVDFDIHACSRCHCGCRTDYSSGVRDTASLVHMTDFTGRECPHGHGHPVLRQWCPHLGQHLPPGLKVRPSPRAERRKGLQARERADARWIKATPPDAVWALRVPLPQG